MAKCKACLFVGDDFERVIEFDSEEHREGYSRGVSETSVDGIEAVLWERDQLCDDEDDKWEIIKKKLGITDK